MLSKKFSNCQLYNKPKNIFGKYGNKAKKVQKKKIWENDEEKENQAGIQNKPVPTVDLTKKIKKLSPKKIMKSQFSFITKPKEQTLNGIRVFREDELGFDEEFVNMIIPQRIDNDVDTDEEQINSGIRKLQRFLFQRCEEEERMWREEDGMAEQ